jgi:glycerol dehydrogenase
MHYAMIAPRKYIQGKGVLNQLGHYAGLFGKKALVVWGKRTKAAVRDIAVPSLEKEGIDFVEKMFPGECTHEMSKEFAEIARTNKAELIIALGGGKILDCAKGAAAELDLPILSVPTIAGTDAPTSGLSVWYNDEGDCLGFDLWKFNPDIVLVDTGVIANAPARYFISGMADALATWLEADASYKNRSLTCSGGLPPIAVMAIAKACYETLLEYGIEAKNAVELQVVTPAVEKCVEANILMSGLGFESGGLGSAHAVANDLPFFHETHAFYHGEKVSFGIVTQLCLEEDLPASEIYRVVDFLVEAGLPVCFEDLNIKDASRDKIMEFGEKVTGPGSLAHNHTFEVTAENLAHAMIAADGLGKRRKQLKRG